MSPEAQRIAIAEACGWKMGTEEVEHIDGFQWTETRKFWTSPTGKRYSLPDYLNDLNAMHEAEKVLTQWEELASYHLWLGYCGENNTSELHNCIHATAAQRAEAFLRTIGEWEDR